MERGNFQKGFTLIELAVVIAIVAILAAVAIPRFADVSDSAEMAMANDMVSKLKSAAAMYTAKQSAQPTGFTDFVTTGAIGSGTQFTLSLANFGTNPGKCVVAATSITCAKGTSFTRIDAAYTWTDGAISSAIQ